MERTLLRQGGGSQSCGRRVVGRTALRDPKAHIDAARVTSRLKSGATDRDRFEKRTKAYLLALSEPCIRIRDDELESIRDNRVLVGVGPADLKRWRPSGSWMLAVLLCPGDDLAPLIRWMARIRADPERIRFYAHPDADAWQLLRSWNDAGHPDPAVDLDIDSWKRLHKRLGLDLSVRILRDWGRPESGPPPDDAP